MGEAIRNPATNSLEAVETWMECRAYSFDASSQGEIVTLSPSLPFPKPDWTVLAIDPGPTYSAWLVWDGQHIINAGKCLNDEMIIRVQESFSTWIAIEMVQSFGMPVGSEVFDTVLYIGRFIQAYQRPEKVQKVFRSEVKMHLCHSMKAKDSNIRQALVDRLGPPGTKKNRGATYGISGDQWSALALAITFYDKYGAVQVEKR